MGSEREQINIYNFRLTVHVKEVTVNMSKIIEEWPYVYVISSSVKSRYCHYCFSCSSNLLRCSRCRFGHYCNETCQRSAWLDHKTECDHLRRIYPKVPTDTVRLITRIISKQQHNESALLESDGRTFKDLMPHSNDIRQDVLRNEHFAQICFLLNEFLPKETLPLVDELLEIFGKICVNSFSISNDDMNPIGVGIYLKLSQLDHSCSPNAAVIFSGARAVLNSLQQSHPPFDPKQIRISYVDLLATTEERQTQLQSQYYFKCDCNKCNNAEFHSLDWLMTSFRCSGTNCDGISVKNQNEDCTLICQKCGKRNENVDELTRFQQYIKWELENFETLRKENDFESLYEKGLKIFRSDKNLLSDLNVYRIRLLDRMFDACLELEKFNEALDFIVCTIKCYKKFYPENYPSVGLQLLKLGKIQLYLQRLNEAHITLQEAVNNLAVSFGTDHSIYKNAKELLYQCRDEMNCRNLTNL